jgi:drug/metabolite transporter (DMT)-like permease
MILAMDETRKSLIGLHAASLLFGGTGLFSKLIPLPAIDITALRSLIAAATLLALATLGGRSVALRSRADCGLMGLCGVLIGVHWATFFHAMQVSSVAVGMVAIFTYPVMTVFLEPFWQGRWPRFSDILCGLGVLAGVACMVPGFSPESPVAQGVFWGCLSAFLFALRNVVQRHYLNGYRGDTSMFYQTLVAGCVALPCMQHPPAMQPLSTWLLLGLLGFFFTAVPHSLFAGSLRSLSAKTAGLIGSLQPLYATVLAALVLGETPALRTVIGGVIIVGAATFESVRRQPAVP